MILYIELIKNVSTLLITLKLSRKLNQSARKALDHRGNDLIISTAQFINDLACRFGLPENACWNIQIH